MLSGTARCTVVSGIVCDIEPNMPIDTAAGSASRGVVNSVKYPAAVPLSVAASSVRG